MTRSLAFTPLASADIEEAYRWYEAQRPGLGDEFEAALDRVLELVRQMPDLGPAVHRHLRRVLVPRAERGLIVDLAADGRPLGIEITAPSKVTLPALNRVLREFGCAPLRRADLAPFRAA